MRIEIFRTGTHRPKGMEAMTFSQEDLDKIVQMNTGKEIPIVVGHPKTSDPAYGWAKQITREDDILFADDPEIAPEMQQLIKEKKYRYVSIELRPDYTIRHIGLLGANPPAVKGLKPVQFSEEEEGVMLFSDEDTTISDPVPVVPTPMKNNPEGTAEPKNVAPKTEDLLDRLRAMEAKVAELEKEKEEKLKAEKQEEFAAFAESQIRDGRLKPDMKDKVVSVLKSLYTNDSGVMAFSDSEPEGARAFKELIESLNPIIKPGRIKELQFSEGNQGTPKVAKTTEELAEIIRNNGE